MNIVTKTASGHTIVRPDTTWEKDNEDFYPPDFVEAISFTPIVFARICKAGRSVGIRFAERYFDSVGFGIFLYPENMIGGSEETFAEASCLDHTSFLPYPTLPLEAATSAEEFVIKKDGQKIGGNWEYSLEAIKEAVSEVSKLVYLRTGDVVAVELDKRNLIATRQEAQSPVSLEGIVGQDCRFRFNIVF